MTTPFEEISAQTRLLSDKEKAALLVDLVSQVTLPDPLEDAQWRAEIADFIKGLDEKNLL